MKIENVELKDRLIINKLNIPSKHIKYFRRPRFYAGYDIPINVDKSLLNIPAVSSIITYGWVLNENIEIETLDENYIKNIQWLKEFYEKIYDTDFRSELIVKKPVHNETESDETALFFSGGLDSTYSLFHNIEKNPRMIMICGYDMYMSKGITLKIRDKWVKNYREFAQKINRRINFIYTNTREILKEDRIRFVGRKYLKNGYWGGLRHGICLAGMGAPLTDYFKNLIMAANGCVEWDTVTKENPYGTGVNVNPNMGWGNIKIQYDGTIHRFRKAQRIKSYLNSGDITLRVCYKSVLNLNCMECKKCLRTFSSLLIVGIDPSKCGFKVKPGTWDLSVKLFKEKKIKKRRVLIHDLPMQKYIRENNPSLPKESRIFFDYFMNLDLEAYIDTLKK